MNIEIEAGTNIYHTHIHMYANDALMPTYMHVRRPTHKHTCIHNDNAKTTSLALKNGLF
jgi:diadenosine tetraphosphate (Ap4A) HIT family hydrolase